MSVHSPCSYNLNQLRIGAAQGKMEWETEIPCVMLRTINQDGCHLLSSSVCDFLLRGIRTDSTLREAAHHLHNLPLCLG